MTTLESMLLSYFINSLWQLPLLFAAGWLAAYVLRSLGPAAEHRAWVSVLLLQALLPAASTIPWDALRTLLNFSGGRPKNALPHVSVVVGPGTAFGNPHLPAWLLAVSAILYVAITTWFAARFVWSLHTIRLIRRDAAEFTLSADAAAHWAQCAQAFGVKGASLSTSSRTYGPITIGIKRKLDLPVKFIGVGEKLGETIAPLHG